MKRLILSLLLVASVTTVFAQRANVNRANNLSRAENPNFTEARNSINAALQDPSTKNLANTWFVAGSIGHREINHLTIQAIRNQQPANQAQVGRAALESLAFLIVADSLDQQPDDRGRVRPRHRRDIQRMVTEHYAFNLLGYGEYLFQERDFAGAFNVFNTFLTIPDLPMVAGTIEKDTIYFMVMYFAAISAANAELPHEAIRLFQTLRVADYETLTVYQHLFEMYGGMNDTVNAVQILKDGIQRFPEQPFFIQNLINHYIRTDQPEMALEYLQKAIRQEPNLAEYRFIEGGLHELLDNDEQAKISFNKALEIDPNHVQTLEALARLHFRRALAIDNTIFTIRDTAQRRAAEARADAEFRLALPYYQRLVALELGNLRHKMMLRNLYYRLRMDAEFDVLNRQIEALTPPTND